MLRKIALDNDYLRYIGHPGGVDRSTRYLLSKDGLHLRFTCTDTVVDDIYQAVRDVRRARCERSLTLPYPILGHYSQLFSNYLPPILSHHALLFSHYSATTYSYHAQLLGHHAPLLSHQTQHNPQSPNATQYKTKSPIKTQSSIKTQSPNKAQSTIETQSSTASHIVFGRKKTSSRSTFKIIQFGGGSDLRCIVYKVSDIMLS